MKEFMKGPEQFKSEINWAKWNPDILKHPELIKEYTAIEKTTKDAGVWMTQPRDYSIFSKVDEVNLNSLKNKLEKGEIPSLYAEDAPRIIAQLENQKIQSTIFQGSPEQFIQQQSSWFKRSYPKGYEKTYRGAYDLNHKNLAEAYPEGRGIFTGDLNTGKHYANNDSEKFYELYHPKSDNSYEIDVNKGSWRDVPIKTLPGMTTDRIVSGGEPYGTTDEIATWIEKNNVDYVTLKNIFDGVEAKYSRIVNNKPGNYLKSTKGNIGFFDLNDPDIYK